MATEAISPETIVDCGAEIPPWVLLVFKATGDRQAAQAEWERAGFDVEVALSDEDAAEFLAVMTPSLIVVEGAAYRPDRR